MTHAQLLLAVILVQQAMFGTVWLGASLLRISRGASRHWMAATWLTALGMLLIVFRGAASVWLTVVAANLALIASQIVLRRGLQIFERVRPTDREHLGLLALGAAGLVASTVLQASMVYVLVIVSAALAWSLLRCAWEVRHALSREFGDRSARLCALPLALVGALFGLRALAGPVLPEVVSAQIQDAGTANTGLLFATMVLGLVLNGSLVAIVWTRMVRRLEYQSDHDALTGLLGRRPLERMLLAEDARRARTGVAYALLSIDIDHFKRINDRHGHAVGDAVLARVARSLRANARESDGVARIGGEEFCVLLPGADLDGAQRAARRLLEAARGLYHPELEATLPVTVSIGVGVAGQWPESVQALMRRVDRALYAAKQAGRDRIALAGPPEPETPATQAAPGG